MNLAALLGAARRAAKRARRLAPLLPPAQRRALRAALVDFDHLAELALAGVRRPYVAPAIELSAFCMEDNPQP